MIKIRTVQIFSIINNNTTILFYYNKCAYAYVFEYLFRYILGVGFWNWICWLQGVQAVNPILHPHQRYMKFWVSTSLIYIVLNYLFLFCVAMISENIFSWFLNPLLSVISRLLVFSAIRSSRHYQTCRHGYLPIDIYDYRSYRYRHSYRYSYRYSCKHRCRHRYRL